MKSNARSQGHHISQQYNAELEELKRHLLEMGGKVEQQLTHALDALVNVDSRKAAAVIADDDAIDRMEMKIDEECNLIIARRQPAASDLRFVLAIIKAIRDLERIADESAKIAKAALKMSEQGALPKGSVDFRSIGQLVQAMLNDALDAFVRHDAQSALAVVQDDAEVDNEYAEAMRSIITQMMEEPTYISQALNVIWALRAFERIGDHAKNICEHVVYMVVGTDIRHEKIERIADKLSG